jgi:hypothetical protein
MTPVRLELYGSLECPHTYLVIHHPRRACASNAGRLSIVWRALALEYVNERANSRPFDGSFPF